MRPKNRSLLGKPRRGSRVKKAIVVGGAVALLGLGAHQAGKALSVQNPDFTGRQKFWTLSSKSMVVSDKNNQKMGESNYKILKASKRAGLRAYEVRVGDKKFGELKQNFAVFGKKYTLTTNNQTETIQRPFAWYKKNWTLSREEKPILKINETNASYWVPGLHRFNLVEPESGQKIGVLNAQWNLRRFLVGRRDYAIKFEKGFEGYLSQGEVVGVLTTIGKAAHQSITIKSVKPASKAK